MSEKKRKPLPAPKRERPPRERATKAEMAERTAYCERMLIEGYRKGEIKRFFKRQWGLSASQIEKYIRRARDNLVQALDCSREELIADAYGYYMQILHDKNADANVRLKARQSADRLLGLRAPIKIAPTTPDGDEPYRMVVEQLDTEDLENLMRIRDKMRDIATGEPESAN